ncbi:uncharacterized protein Fot_20184 [Forsythia ovata]|uniref:Uncharacterized protein n=1 Tax=Forsythia ovata TaxID=205694 RepID=A0ABD1VPV0_9LAMI
MFPLNLRYIWVYGRDLSTRAFLDEAECKIQGGLMIGTWEGFCLTCPVAEPCSSETTREADGASPVSVLEAPFTEDSSSESFERVSTELHAFPKLKLQQAAAIEIYQIMR